MVKCKFCGYDNIEGNKYCIHCSKKLLSSVTDNQQTTTINDDEVLYYLSENSYQNDYFNKSYNDNLETFNMGEFNPYITTKKQFIATISSVILCGLGYFYLRQWKNGILFLFGQIFLLIFTSILFSLFKLPIIVHLMYIAAIIIYLVNIYDTYKESGKIR